MSRDFMHLNVMREQNTTNHGKSLEETGDAGEHEVGMSNCVAFFWEDRGYWTIYSY